MRAARWERGAQELSGVRFGHRKSRRGSVHAVMRCSGSVRMLSASASSFKWP